MDYSKGKNNSTVSIWINHDPNMGLALTGLHEFGMEHIRTYSFGLMTVIYK